MGDWRLVKFGDVASIKHGWPFKSKLCSLELTGRPIVVNTGNYRYDGGFRFDETVTREYIGEFPSEYITEPGDILVIMTCQTPGGEILGVPGRIPNDGRIYLHNQRLGKVVIKSKKELDSGYIYWVCLWSVFNQHLVATATGTKILHTAPNRIEGFRFSLPSFFEQRAIAQLLNALQGKIELNRQTNETLEALARAIFKDWFVDFGPTRAMAEGRPPYLAPELWALFPDTLDDEDKPEGWEVKSLDEIAKFLNGLALQKFPASDGEDSLPVIKIAELRGGISEKSNRASRELPEKYVVTDGDFLFSWSGSLLAKFWTEGEGALNQHLFKVSSDRYPAWFFSQWVYHHLEAFQAIAASKATTMGHIQRGHLKAAMTTCPPDDVLSILGETVAPLVDACIKNELESRTLAKTRDFLLPKLMSGEIRLQDAERIVGEVT